MITVALPVYDSKEIVWLPMEGLCRQKVDEPWELLICEEVQENQAGAKFFEGYWPRLQEAGCVNMNYIELEEWVNLPKKWRLLAQKAQGDVFVLQAADCYSDSDRLARARRGLNDAHWSQDKKGHFYLAGTNKLIQFIGNNNKNYRTALNLATRTELIEDLPETSLNKGVDQWMVAHISNRVKIKINTFDDDFGTLDVDGVNNISLLRWRYFYKTTIPYRKATKALSDILEPELIERLRAIKPKQREQKLMIMPQREFIKEYMPINAKVGDVRELSPPVAALLEKEGFVKRPEVKQKAEIKSEVKPKIQSNAGNKSAKKRRGVQKRTSNRSS